MTEDRICRRFIKGRTTATMARHSPKASHLLLYLAPKLSLDTKHEGSHSWSDWLHWVCRFCERSVYLHAELMRTHVFRLPAAQAFVRAGHEVYGQTRSQGKVKLLQSEESKS